MEYRLSKNVKMLQQILSLQKTTMHCKSKVRDRVIKYNNMLKK